MFEPARTFVRVLLVAMLVARMVRLSLAQQACFGVQKDGKIFVQSLERTVRTGTIDIMSWGGFIVPIPPGDLTAPAAPFQVLLANNDRQVTLGNLGIATAIDELLLEAKYLGTDPASDLRVSRGEGSTPQVIPFCDSSLGSVVARIATDGQISLLGRASISRITLSTSVENKFAQLGQAGGVGPFTSVEIHSPWVAQLIGTVDLNGELTLPIVYEGVDPISTLRVFLHSPNKIGRATVVVLEPNTLIWPLLGSLVGLVRRRCMVSEIHGA